jgi:carbonic anhydrase/acetyltransferase-like protein (isoleucine patch superfamily)
MFTRKGSYVIPEGYREELQATWPCMGYRGHLQADPTSYISPECRIYGAVELGHHAIVMAGAQLRGDSDRIVIGAESNVQENCIIHEGSGMPTIVGEHSTIGHGAILHGCTIGDNALVGMGAVVLDGAHVGNNALVGAGALVTSGMVIPDGCIAMGVPAKVRGELSPERIVELITSFAEVNLIEAENMFAEGLLEHPSEELLHTIGALR